MEKKFFLPLIAFFLATFALACSVNALSVKVFWGQGCPHCASTISLFENELVSEYDLQVEKLEVYANAENREKLLQTYQEFGVSEGTGVPTTIVGGNTLVIGGLEKNQWKELFDYCAEAGCPQSVLSHANFNLPSKPGATGAPSASPTPSATAQPISVTIPVLVGAALIDSINPCTIAVMVLLLGVILVSGGRRKALAAGLLFSATVFAMYFLMGLGIFKAITSVGVTQVFYSLVTVAALALAVMEFRAYFDYKPGFGSVEMPLFLRPYAKKATSGAGSLAGVVVAGVLCSLFLLPCSSGPYLMMLGMLAKNVSVEAIGYLALYNAIFVAPMVLISIAIFFGKTTVEKIHAEKERYIREIHLVSGALFLALFLLMLNELFHFV